MFLVSKLIKAKQQATAYTHTRNDFRRGLFCVEDSVMMNSKQASRNNTWIESPRTGKNSRHSQWLPALCQPVYNSAQRQLASYRARLGQFHQNLVVGIPKSPLVWRLVQGCIPARSHSHSPCLLAHLSRGFAQARVSTG